MPPSHADVAGLAAVLERARRAGQPADVPPVSLDGVADAYRVQDAVAAGLGPVVGWKVGARSPEAVPLCAPLLAGALAPPSARHEHRAGEPIGVEVEIAFVLGRAFPAAGQVPASEEVLDAVASCHIAIELCAMRWRADPDTIDPLLKLADNQMNERLLLGPEIAAWRGADFDALAARLTVDGRPAETPTRPTAGDLRGLLVWLVRHCVAERGGIAAGAAVTTGSWTGMHFVAPPARVVGTIGAFPQIELTLGR